MADVRLCHASCFWSGSTNLLDTLIEIRKFLQSNTREVITIIFEDYLKNPTILKRVFDQAGISPYVLLKENWGDEFNDWSTLRDMRKLGRLVVFNNNGLRGFPYTEWNMWHYVRENRYGNPGQNVKVQQVSLYCVNMIKLLRESISNIVKYWVVGPKDISNQGNLFLSLIE